MIRKSTLFLVLFALISSCGSNEKPDLNQAPQQSISDSYEILCEVKTSDSLYLESFEDGIIPWISIQNAASQVDNLIGKNDIVLTSQTALIIIDYPLNKPCEIKIKSDNPTGFTKAELILKISNEYKRIYKEEEESASTKTTPMEERGGIINRNETNGKYGIWGHDLIDLDLSAIVVHNKKGKIPTLELYIDS